MKEITHSLSGPARQRDIRLDFFRGLVLLIMLISHVPSNAWVNWVPARFGFSDPADIFVFCSGMASGIAFGGIFERAGSMLGSVRVVQRLWQLYWSQIAVFVAIVAMLSAADHFIPGAHYVRSGVFNLGHFLDEPGWMLAHYLTFTYVPNYFDIIPMYIGLLAMIPLFAVVAEWSRVLVGTICVLVWLAAAMHLLELPAEPWSTRPWYFNPFSWQLLFFTGYAFGRGWLCRPKPRAWLIAAAVGVVAISVPLACASCFPELDKHIPGLSRLQAQLAVFGDKTHAGAARYVHFMALAYLASLASGAGGRRLCGWFAEILRTTGRETLPVFLVSLVLSQALGIFLDLAGRSWEMVALANIGGCIALVLIAHVIAWFKRSPWDDRARLDALAQRSVLDAPQLEIVRIDTPIHSHTQRKQ